MPDGTRTCVRSVSVACFCALWLALISLLFPMCALGAGLSLGWLDCRAQGGAGSSDLGPGCESTISEYALFPGIVLATPQDSVLSMELVIDVDVAADSLPAWWHMESGGCRAGGWRADTAPALSCDDAWGGLGTANVQGWLVGSPGNSRRHGRLLVAVSAIPGNLIGLAADVPYSACRVLLRTNNTPDCPGCSTPACLVFNSLLIRRAPGSSVEEIFYAAAESAGSNMVQWQGALGADCQSVPVRRTTWGAVKSLYR